MRLVRLAYHFLVRQTMPWPAVGCYDRLINTVAEFYLRPLCDEIAAAFPSASTILDIGTGAGHLPIMLAQGKANYRIIGVDLSRACLRVARRRAAKAGVADRVSFVRANLVKGACDLPPADLAVSTCSLHHWRWPVRVLRATARLLKPSGEIWLMDDFSEASDGARRQWVERVEKTANPGWLFRTVFWFENRFLAYSRDELAAMVTKAGLELIEFKTRDVFFIARIRRPQMGVSQQAPSYPSLLRYTTSSRM